MSWSRRASSAALILPTISALLVNMGVLPLQFPAGTTRKTLGLIGRLGPDTLSTVERSISITLVYSAGGASSSRHNPCALQSRPPPARRAPRPDR